VLLGCGLLMRRRGCEFMRIERNHSRWSAPNARPLRAFGATDGASRRSHRDSSRARCGGVRPDRSELCCTHEHADASDRRRNVITITPAGRRLLRKLDAVMAEIQDELLAPLSARERKQLVSLLTRVLDDQSPPAMGPESSAVKSNITRR
jgi:hypothetical protein